MTAFRPLCVIYLVLKESGLTAEARHVEEVLVHVLAQVLVLLLSLARCATLLIVSTSLFSILSHPPFFIHPFNILFYSKRLKARDDARFVFMLLQVSRLLSREISFPAATLFSSHPLNFISPSSHHYFRTQSSRINPHTRSLLT